MKKSYIYIILIILIISVATILFAKNNNNEIEIDKETKIEQLKDIKIKGTNDSFKITDYVKLPVYKHEDGKTVSFEVVIPYYFDIDGKKYTGNYYLVNNDKSELDNNPKYKIQVTSLTANGEIRILIKKQ